MRIREKCSLVRMNTFGMDVKAECVIDWSTPEELIGLIPQLVGPVLMIGQGSNMLFLNDYEGTVLHSAITGIDLLEANDTDYAYVRVGSGVIWDDFVVWCCLHNLWGAENLSGIPGEVGAAAVQNIGAYGVEAKDIIDTVQTISLSNGTQRDFSNHECQYAYRQSIFKNELKGEYAVSYVIFKLWHRPLPRLDYGALEQEVKKRGDITLCHIRESVLAIRDSKLPNPQVLGNAGSFFMNPVISERQYNDLMRSFPTMPSYPSGEGMVKVPAGWLIENVGWKGRSLGSAAVYDKQALVIVNNGGAVGADIKRLADTVIEDVYNRFGITLSTEVNYI